MNESKGKVTVVSGADGPTLAQPAEVTQHRVDQYVPMSLVDTPEEVANPAPHLASASPAFQQGQDIVNDGGHVIH